MVYAGTGTVFPKSFPGMMLTAWPVRRDEAHYEEGDGETQKHKNGSRLSSEADGVNSNVLLTFDGMRVHFELVSAGMKYSESSANMIDYRWY